VPSNINPILCPGIVDRISPGPVYGRQEFGEKRKALFAMERGESSSGSI